MRNPTLPPLVCFHFLPLLCILPQARRVPLLDSKAVHAHLSHVSEHEVLERARQYIIDALQRRSILLQSLSPQQNKVALWLRSTIYDGFITLVLIAQLFLAAFEGPNRHLPDFHYTLTWTEAIFRWTILFFLIADICLRLYSQTIRIYFEKIPKTIYVAIVFAMFFTSFTSGYFYLAALRPILLIIKNTQLRRIFTTILKTIPRTLDVWLCFICILVFYAGIGKLAFSGMYDFETCGNSGLNTWDAFDTVPSGVFALLTATTTENYPSIMYPAYVHGSKGFALFYFLSFTLVSVFLLMPLLLGRVYDEWREQHELDCKRNKVRAYHALIAAYQMIRGVSNTDTSDTQSIADGLPSGGGGGGIYNAPTGGNELDNDSYLGQRKLDLSLWMKLMQRVQVTPTVPPHPPYTPPHAQPCMQQSCNTYTYLHIYSLAKVCSRCSTCSCFLMLTEAAR